MALLKQENVPLAEGKVLIPAVKKPHLVQQADPPDSLLRWKVSSTLQG